MSVPQYRQKRESRVSRTRLSIRFKDLPKIQETNYLDYRV